ncbi:MAG: phosphoribosylamine--glycine ligase [Candidatus Scalindua rubra]|uniref:Phosphoribosylamine--glycine ligase n=1 Tax=Candidatus Scalindua brodae TaxID=237368 RepID=A0A0B0ELX5_9BACT|nr:MAG: phosphoribosylamine/glycine ligase [Candidatus Scalindua brodae]MBZ0110545.1 phosphoribosylamine--glycine ligase [Candidatus Scalindua rubra]TWU30785.1 Phosphoribosylamine--glycine ligase [Candidatus Brocadiaceae bacterium S225]
MKVLVIGGGGREHSLVWKIAQSPLVSKIFCAPGNPGISELAECINITADQIDLLCKFAVKKNIDLTVVGPEAPLVDGIVDVFGKYELKVFGPDKKAAILEDSKVFSKLLLKKHGIPTADFKCFDNYKHARQYVLSKEAPIVVKADGLSKGKGVFVCKTNEEALRAVGSIMKDRVFGNAGNQVVIEECLAGEEISLLAFTDGRNIVAMESSQDHKTVFDGDKGPNTGGMGAYSPVPIMTSELYLRVEKEILVPTVHAMNREGRPYKGVIYIGLMITSSGPMVLEFNVRFGDPEAQVILSRMKSDIVPIMLATISGELDKVDLEWYPQASVCVVMASGGYPGIYDNGKGITGLDLLKNQDGISVFHAGTKSAGGKIVTNGGRVLNVVACGEDIEDAQKKVYEAVSKISFDGAHYRMDIASKAITNPHVSAI